MNASNASGATALGVPRLETARLVLRPWRSDDAPSYMHLLGDPEVMRFIGAGLRYRIKRAAASVVGMVSNLEAERAIAKLIEHWRVWGFGEWAVEEAASGVLIGQVGLVHHADWIADPSRIEIGWMLARRAWGHGFAAEAATAALAHAFDGLRLERIISIARVGNHRSERVMARIGLSYTGRTWWKGGTVIWYALDRDAWLRREA